jgi:hypothetical protein
MQNVSVITAATVCDHAGHTTMTRTDVTSTNLILIDDTHNDESWKRNSLGLARDSLELLRHTHTIHSMDNERSIPSRSMDSSTPKRKSVLKSRLDNSDQIVTPELISYVAIDCMKGDKHLVDKQLRYESQYRTIRIVINRCSTFQATFVNSRRQYSCIM